MHDYPVLFYILIWCQLTGVWIHFILQLSNVYLICKSPLINSINFQTEMASLFLPTFPALTEVDFQSLGLSLVFHDLTVREGMHTYMECHGPEQDFHHGHPH